jgi:hypothetical protein
VASRGARVILEVPRPLARLAASLEGPMQVISSGAPEPDADFCCPLLSLPQRLATTLQTIPGRVPYLAAEPAMAAAWRHRLAALSGMRVGLVCAGNPRPFMPEANAIDRRLHGSRAILDADGRARGVLRVIAEGRGRFSDPVAAGGHDHP